PDHGAPVPLGVLFPPVRAASRGLRRRPGHRGPTTPEAPYRRVPRPPGAAPTFPLLPPAHPLDMPCDTPSCPPPGPALPSPHLRAGTTVSRTPATPPHDGRVRHEPGDPAARAGCRSRTQVGAGGALGPRRPLGVPRTTPLPPHPLATARRPQGPRLHGRRHPRRALRLGDPAGERGRGLHVPTPGGTAQR